MTQSVGSIFVPLGFPQLGTKTSVAWHHRVQWKHLATGRKRLATSRPVRFALGDSERAHFSLHRQATSGERCLMETNLYFCVRYRSNLPRGKVKVLKKIETNLQLKVYPYRKILSGGNFYSLEAV